MDFDEQLLTQNHPAKLFARIYLWQKPGITQAFNKNFPKDLLSLDHQHRCTGGGLVFHSPKDVLLTLITPLQTTGQKIKPILTELQSYIHKSIKDLKTINHKSTSNVFSNINSCQHYHSPFELFYQNTKCVAIAARKFSNKLILQCIIHNGDTLYFKNKIPTKYMSYLANPLKVCPNKLQENLIQNLYKNTFFTHSL